MILLTTSGVQVDAQMIQNYFHNLVNLFFKILPMREHEEETLCQYMCNLRDELLGCKELIAALENDALFASLIFNLQYMIDRPDIPVAEVRSKVFQSISTCNKLKCRYDNKEVLQ